MCCGASATSTMRNAYQANRIVLSRNASSRSAQLRPDGTTEVIVIKPFSRNAVGAIMFLRPDQLHYYEINGYVERHTAPPEPPVLSGVESDVESLAGSVGSS